MRESFVSKSACKTTAVALLTLLALSLPARAQQATSSTAPNSVPLVFGMNADQVSEALGVPLNYVRGRPGDELYLAVPNVKGAALANRSDGLYLQFRKRALTGWKGDWGTVRP
jgi:hypothetical protein